MLVVSGEWLNGAAGLFVLQVAKHSPEFVGLATISECALFVSIQPSIAPATRRTSRFQRLLAKARQNNRMSRMTRNLRRLILGRQTTGGEISWRDIATGRT